MCHFQRPLLQPRRGRSLFALPVKFQVILILSKVDPQCSLKTDIFTACRRKTDVGALLWKTKYGGKSRAWSYSEVRTWAQSLFLNAFVVMPIFPSQTICPRIELPISKAQWKRLWKQKVFKHKKGGISFCMVDKHSRAHKRQGKNMF